jgi:hypothetical protein
MKRNLSAFGIVLMVFAVFAIQGCEPMPPGKAGAAPPPPIQVAKVKSTVDPVHAVSKSGTTFFVKSQDSSNAGVDLRPAVVKALTNLGISEARDMNSADYVIDMVVGDYATGTVGMEKVNNVLAASAGDDPDSQAGAAILSGLFSLGKPDYVTFKVDLVLDELVYSGGKHHGKHHARHGKPQDVQTKTMLIGYAQYIPGKATQQDATRAVEGSIANFVARMLR